MDVLRNLRFAIRTLRKNPGFTAVALLTLALGIGANAAIYSVVRAVVLSPLPYPDADRVVRVWSEKQVSTEYLLVFEEETHSFAALSGYEPATVALTGDDRPEELSATRVSPSHFDVLGVAPSPGRAFAPEEREPGRDAVAIISHRLWQRRFGGDPEIVGRTITLDGRGRAVVGVMPAPFRPLDPACDVWLPHTVEPGTERHTHWFFTHMIARLAPDVAREAARDDVRRVIARLREKDPDMVASSAVETATVTPLLDQVVGETRATLWTLFGAVGLVLLTACANVASLVLARVNGRRRELAVRGALGAGRGRLLGELLTESLVLSLGGALLGLLAASWTAAWLRERLASSLPRTDEITVDGGVLVFTLAASLVAALAFGLLPAWRAARLDVQPALRSGGRGTTERHRLHHALIAAEIAVAVVLVTGAGLLVKSFWQLRQVDPGFDPENLLTLKVQPPAARYDDDEKRRIYYQRVAEEIAAVPGVAEVGAINMLPMTPGTIALAAMPEGRPVATDEPAPAVTFRMVTPELMEMLGVTLLGGRQLAPTDRADTAPVGLVNQTLAREFWGDEDPVGKKVVYDDGSLWFTVVGVVADLRQHRLDRDALPQAYMSIAQQSWTSRMYYLVRATTEPLALLPAVERAVWTVDDDVPVTRVATMDAVIHRSLTAPRQLTGLFSLFGALALALGAVGVYGVTAYAVSQRTHENGVRLALGATGMSVLRVNLGRVMTPVVVGLALGLAGSWALTRLLAAHLYRVEATDPVVFLAVAALLAGAAAVAGYLPSRRAARVDPMVVLGAE